MRGCDESKINLFRIAHDFQVAELAKKFVRNLSAVLSELLDYLFVQPDIHGG
jgi:hypothetical protein